MARACIRIHTHRNHNGIDHAQAVIVGSAVDWSSDPELLETMVSLAEPYNG